MAGSWLRAGVPSALSTGVLLGLSSLPGPLGPLGFVALVPLLRALAAGPRPGAAGAWGLLAGLVCFGIGFGWVPSARAGGGMAPAVAFGLLVLYLASFVAAFAAAVAWAAARSRRLALAAAPGVWVALEFARSQEWLLPVPWCHLGYALADSAVLAQAASLVGLYGLSFWMVAANAGAVALAGLPALTRPPLLAALALPLAAGLDLPGEGAEAAVSGARLRVAAVQPGIAEEDRHRSERFHPNLRLLLGLTERALAEPAELVVWPESAYERAAGAGGDAFLGAVARHLGAPVLTGAWRSPGPGDARWRNAALLAPAGGEARARFVAEKVHPIPVYERAPESRLGRALARTGFWSGRFARGRPAEPVAIRSSGGEETSIGVLVCIDASYPELARGLRERGARLLVTVANEAGAGAWPAALHARAARLRAIESRVPVVRVANTGPTLWIDARGRIRAALPPGEAAAGAHELELAGPPPPFVGLGDAPVAGLAAATAAAALLAARAAALESSLRRAPRAIARAGSAESREGSIACPREAGRSRGVASVSWSQRRSRGSMASTP
jgi:apolipoprotein N-acyltransferase